jgi:transposase-like protein
MEDNLEHGSRIGDLLVQEGFITKGQLERALQAQQAGSPYKPLGEVCKDLGLISRTTLRDFLDQHRKRLLLGDLLLRMGAISEAALMGGLEAQGQTKERLGEILVKRSVISREALTNALGIQLTIPTMEPDAGLVDFDLVNSVSSRFLYNKNVVPVCHKQVEGVITVIMEDPLDHETISDLEKIFGSRVEPAMLTHGQIRGLLDDVFASWLNHLNVHSEEEPPARPAAPPPAPKRKGFLAGFIPGMLT